MLRPTIAVCIPTYNQSRFLATAVESAIGQTLACEIWVADDASTDDTPAVMEELKKRFPNVHYHQQRQNLGIMGNPTWVMKQSDAEFIVRLDSDDILKPDYVRKLLGVLENHPQAGCAHAAVQEIGEDGQERRLRLLARNAGLQNGEESLRASVSGYRVAANICMFRSAALKQADYYRDLSFCEDWDLAVRLADAGWGNVYIDEVLASYRAWETPVRIRRKLAEINGCRRVIEESLIPAFARRNWDLSPILRSRRQLALRHAESLRTKHFTTEEKAALKEALCRLGDSPALRWKFRWVQTPLAGLFQLPHTAMSRLKLVAKKILFARSR